MGRVALFWSRLESASRNPRLALVLAITAGLVTLVSLGLALRSPERTLRISAGDEQGRRHQVAQVLRDHLEEHGIHVVLEPTSGSADALERVASGRLDAALVQGGLPCGPRIREVAPLTFEPLHLLVRDAAILRLDDLRHRRIDLGPEGSGTRALSLELLALVHMQPGRDFEEEPLSYDELQSKPADQLPDAFFHVSTLPSPVAEFLMRRRGYRLLALPYADAMHLRDIAVRPGRIPAFAYGVSPAHPPEEVPSIATRMLIVARDDADEDTIRRILEVLASDTFARDSRLPERLETAAMTQPEIPLHHGAEQWLRRNDPLVTPELIDNVESMRSFLVSLFVALFLGWRWWRARQLLGFEKYLHQVTDLEREVLKLELEADLDLIRLLQIQRRLGQLKNEALEGYGAGRIASADLLNGFLAHVTDVRSYLNALVLHERERLEKKARRSEDHEDELRRELWRDAVGGLEEEGGEENA
ncbi:MAG: hypothetical protein KC619_17435 [Myxococcales bacterium]|nr:hypothetical protein [Myxococcales bacterium]